MKHHPLETGSIVTFSWVVTDLFWVALSQAAPVGLQYTFRTREIVSRQVANPICLPGMSEMLACLSKKKGNDDKLAMVSECSSGKRGKSG